MYSVAFVLLSCLSLIVFANMPLVGTILGGLLAIGFGLLLKVNALTKKNSEQNKDIVRINDRLKQLESQPQPQASDEETIDETVPAKEEPPESHSESDEVLLPERTDLNAAAWMSKPHEDTTSSKAIKIEHEQVAQGTVEAITNVEPIIEPHTFDNSTDNAEQQNAEPADVYIEPVGPQRPSFIDRVLKAGWDWFTDGNIFVRVGIIILFMGMTFLIRYAIDKNMLPIEVRLAGVSAVAIALLYWGWRQRDKRETFALMVQGGGIGLLYLTIFAGFSLYHVIPSGLAFVLLALIVMLAAMLAILQDAKPLALFATVGGFLAPVLTSSGSNNYIGLFSYYTILNLGIFTIAWFKSWRLLNFVGFLFTFAITSIWGVLSYEQAYFATTEPFLIIFFLMYVAIGILFARNRSEFYKDYVDSSLIFGTPLLAFGLQCAMVNEYEYGVAISAFSLAAFYILLTQYLWKKFGDDLRLLAETFLALGVIFATLAVPFAIDGTLTGATWAIEGAGILWVSIKQAQKYRRLFGIALIFAAGVMLASELLIPAAGVAPVFKHAFINSAFIGCIIIMLAASGSSWLLSKDYSGKLELEKTLSLALLIYGLFVLFTGFEYQIRYFALHQTHGTLLAILATVCTLGFIIEGNRLTWSRAYWVAILMIAPIAIAAMLCFEHQPQLSEHYGYLVWPACLLIYFYALKCSLTIIPEKLLLIAHATAASVIVGLLLWDGLWQLLLGYSLLAILFNQLANNRDWPQLKILSLGFLPVLVMCAAGAINIDGNLIDLSNIASTLKWPFPPGYVLWPSGFAVYFYLLYQNPKVAEFSTSRMHYAGAALVYGLLLWLGAWPLLLGALLLGLLCCVLWQRYKWQEMYVTSLAILPIMWLVTFLNLFDNSFHAFALRDYNLNLNISHELGYLLWPLAFASLFWCYKQYDKLEKPASATFQGLALILPVLLVTWEASWHILDYAPFMNAWHLAWLPLSAMLVITLIMKNGHWPFSEHRRSYQKIALPLLALLPLMWSLLQLTSSADSSPLPWIPIINPVDIIQCIIIIGLIMWSEEIIIAMQIPLEKKALHNGILAFVFLWMNIELLRAVHYWGDVPWQMPTILSDDISQTALSLFWALAGLLTTVYSSRKQKRTLWLVGSILLGFVVLKLFVIDLSARETIERIVSFTGVGLLLMLVGYFSPLPPKKIVEPSEADNAL